MATPKNPAPVADAKRTPGGLAFQQAMRAEGLEPTGFHYSSDPSAEQREQAARNLGCPVSDLVSRQAPHGTWSLFRAITKAEDR